jgi:hypothetical protein
MGGNAIKNSVPVQARNARKIALNISESLQNYFNVPTAILGSVMKKYDDMYCGDIDIAIQLPWTDNNVERVKQYGLEHLPVNEVVVSYGLKLVSYGYEDNNTNLVHQVDIMFTENIKYSEFMYYSPDYTKNESRFKGLYRTNLLIICAGNIPLDKNIYSNTYYTNEDFEGKYTGELKEFYKYTLTYDNGLELRKKSTLGKTRMCKKAYTISKEKITDNIMQILTLIFGDNIDYNMSTSYENIIKMLYSPDYKYGSEVRNNILKEFLLDPRHTKDKDIYIDLISEIKKYAKNFIVKSKLFNYFNYKLYK